MTSREQPLARSATAATSTVTRSARRSHVRIALTSHIRRPSAPLPPVPILPVRAAGRKGFFGNRGPAAVSGRGQPCWGLQQLHVYKGYRRSDNDPDNRPDPIQDCPVPSQLHRIEQQRAHN